MRSSGGLKPRYPLMDISLMILDHIVAQDVRGLDIPYHPYLTLDLRRDSAPAARRPCKDVVTTYLFLMMGLTMGLELQKCGTRTVLYPRIVRKWE